MKIVRVINKFVRRINKIVRHTFCPRWWAYLIKKIVSLVRNFVSPKKQIVSPERKIVSQSDYDELRVLRDNVYNLQSDLQDAYKRIKRLNDNLQRIATKEGKK
tara:strand:+ start:1279 stop:1587 length:309 start_codon:yes stop_codon:yes gene_type:complete